MRCGAITLVLRQCENEGLSLRAQRSNLYKETASERDCFVALLLAMTPQNHPDGLLAGHWTFRLSSRSHHGPRHQDGLADVTGFTDGSPGNDLQVKYKNGIEDFHQ